MTRAYEVVIILTTITCLSLNIMTVAQWELSRSCDIYAKKKYIDILSCFVLALAVKGVS